ncbi:MAG: sugar phosphate isomerase/epimerase [Clostridium sp.]|jgi:2-keto-myo-inositol isomerase|uniref:sugar phosphate isomerase/epimerase family protein n=1 Tax=Clostridium sp. TaxID=1506 RepID=UPI0025BAF4BC|nr:sugar phosphate isomerase/epimerase family protein [Clostridium sp.]MCH3964810.1 sugar phosphate isomerase/epimerase [Clostridium sp.]MCI1715281.1 sugar phosphate isomerase/epimerase [Clostridium sp.]MCI1799543.1 sugar phosphate isomerase/epimerase [Clostridium sp.]MCI1813464.1 sugar phosphate isomerase/epimerase [Clostridium sp.]MCI1870355.1 sugar phosphate isomerase/epimerase [Clostridium sp.]
MKLGFNEATCMKKSNVEMDLKLCEKYGYDYIELRLDMLKEYFKHNTVKDLKNFFETSSLKPFALNSIENINFCSKAQWKELVDLFTFGCEVAGEIGNPYIVVVPTVGQKVSDRNEQEVFIDSVNVLNKLADIAEAYGVKLAFEPIGNRRWVCNSIRQAYEIISSINRDNVGLVIDCINFYLNDKCADIEYLREIPKDKIFVFHINDCENLPLGILDHCHRLFPGDGCIPINRIMDILKEKGYDKIASLELFRPEYWNMKPEDVIRIGAEKTKVYL